LSGESKEILDAGIEKEKVSEVYRKMAPVYDFFSELAESRAHSRGLELAAIRNGDSVLEVAVGTGTLFEMILKINPDGRNEGIDITPEMLSRAEVKANRTGIRNYRLRIGDAYAIDFLDNTFDVLIANYMFDMLPEGDFHIVLKEFMRVLRPGGRLVITSMTKGLHWYNNWGELIYRMNPEWFGGCRGVLLLPHLETAGFVNAQREYISELTFPSEVVYGEKSKADTTSAC
jgi:ubiquinone/menaquinone biosynthesis C-methylase UbiE